MNIRFLIVAAAVVAWAVCAASAGDKQGKKLSPGKVQQGSIIFNNTGYFAPGSKSCASCHIVCGRNDLADSRVRRHEKRLIEEINDCIVDRVGGQARKEDSTVMRALVAYIQSLEGEERIRPRVR